jgi:uncharacterized delta-60 repeat protein
LGALALALAGGAAAQAQPPGTLDSTFNGSGVLTLGSGTQLFGVAVQANGEIVAAGQSAGNVLVERFSTTGAVDGTYVGGSGVARAVAIQPDGKVVIAGSSGSAMFAERLTPALTPDASFGAGGVATALQNQFAVANGVAIAPDGSIVAAGSVGAIDTRAGVARFSPSGSVDWSESPGFDHYSVIEAVAAQADGKIVFVGHQTPLQVTDALIGRLNPDGSLDATFAGGVFTYHYPSGGYTGLNAVQVQNDGKVVAAGVDVGGPNAIFVRVNGNGSFDTGFGSGGVAALPSAENLSNNSGAPIGANGIGIAGGGRIVGAGVLDNSGTIFDAAAWAFTPAGAPESSFGSGGTVAAPADAPRNGYEACALAIAPDGSLVSAGDRVTGYSDPSPCSVTSSSAGFVARYIGFGPPPPRGPVSTKPAVTTGAASTIGETSATVSGQVNPEGLSTNYHFQYGTTTGYSGGTATLTLGAGTAAVPVSQTLSGLAPATTYHYRLVASNGDGTTDGQDMTFTTASSKAPSVTTGKPTGVGEVSATLTGAVNASGLGTSYHFDYGTTRAYGSSTRGKSTTGSVPVAVAAHLARLKPGTTYHYRLVASNADGTSYGADRTLTTAPKLALSLSSGASSYKINALQHGLSLGVRCSQACSIRGALLISGPVAKQLKLGTRQMSIATGLLTLKRSGRGTLVLGLTSKAKSAIAQLVGIQATLRIVAAPTRGGPRRSRSVTISLTR